MNSFLKISPQRQQDRSIIENRFKKHFKKRLYERVGIHVSDAEYYKLCEIACRRSIKMQEMGFVNGDKTKVTLSLRGRLFDCIFDFLEGFLITVLTGPIRFIPFHKSDLT